MTYGEGTDSLTMTCGNPVRKDPDTTFNVK